MKKGKKHEEQSTQLSNEIALRKKVDDELKIANEKVATMENKLHTSNIDLSVLQEKLSVSERDYENVSTDRNILLQKLDEIKKKCDEQSSQLKNQIALHEKTEDQLKKEKEKVANMENNVQTSKNDLALLQDKISAGEREREQSATQMKAAQSKILDLCKNLLKTQHELRDSVAEHDVTKKNLQEEKDFNEILTKEFQLISADAYQPLTDQRLEIYFL